MWKKSLIIFLSFFFIINVQSYHILYFDFDNQAEADRLTQGFVLPSYGIYCANRIFRDNREYFRVSFITDNLNFAEVDRTIVSIFNRNLYWTTFDVARLENAGINWREWLNQ